MKNRPMALLMSAVMVAMLTQCSPAASEHQKPVSSEQVKIKLMTSLPIIWGESGDMQDILSGKSSPAPIYTYWQDRYVMEPVDSLEGLVASSTDIVMLVQPRAMAPADLAELDRWVRAGGKAIILTDPNLIWPSDLTLGDARRPLRSGLLSPLLTHWGLELVAQDEEASLVELEFAEFRFATVGVGSFVNLSKQPKSDVTCELSDASFVAQCQVGKGRVILVADADFMHERLWADDIGWQQTKESDAMRFTKALIDQIRYTSDD